MSRFFKALEQAERDAAERRQGASAAEPRSSVPPDAAGATAPAGAGLDPSLAAISPVPSAWPAPQEAHTRPAAPATAARPGPAGIPHPSGAEPKLSHGYRAAVSPRFVSLVNPTGFEAEQYRALRHIIEHTGHERRITVVAVSSAAVGDGKTTTAINLAGALAQGSTARILLIDTDLRRPAIAKALAPEDADIVSPPGLVDAVLDPQLRLEDVVQAYSLNLDVLPAGGTAEAPYELLMSPRFAALLEEARGRYHYVVLDTPPLVPLPDCRIIERLADGLLIVVGAHRTPRKLVEEALDAVDPEKVLGLVFNADDGPRPGYYRAYGYAHAVNGSAGRWMRLLRRHGPSGAASNGRAPGARP